MKANETKFQPVIEGTKQYVLPLFQRSYSWDKKEWDVLWNDLMELSEMSHPRDHFIGSIVSMPTISVPEGVAKYLLIDGQQRLTTFFIILALLRDIAKQSGKVELAEEINNTLIVNPYKKDSDYFKLLPTQVDRGTYERLILSKIETDDQSQIYKAYQYFDRKLKQSKIDLSTLKIIISNHLSVVSIVLCFLQVKIPHFCKIFFPTPCGEFLYKPSQELLPYIYIFINKLLGISSVQLRC